MDKKYERMMTDPNTGKLGEEYPFGYSIPEMDVDAFLNLRDWLESAITSKGAKVDGAGIGLGQADISFALEGVRYSVSIRPLPTATKQLGK